MTGGKSKFPVFKTFPRFVRLQGLPSHWLGPRQTHRWQNAERPARRTTTGRIKSEGRQNLNNAHIFLHLIF